MSEREFREIERIKDILRDHLDFADERCPTMHAWDFASYLHSRGLRLVASKPLSRQTAPQQESER